MPTFASKPIYIGAAFECCGSEFIVRTEVGAVGPRNGVLIKVRGRTVLQPVCPKCGAQPKIEVESLSGNEA